MKSYILPQGNVQISFSGGRTSAYMLHQILEANGGLPDRAKVVFSNTGREMPQTLDFVQEVSDRWSVPVVWVEDAERGKGPIFDVVSHNSASRNGEPFERLIRRKKACPDQSKRFCTEHLKILPARRFLLSLGWQHWVNCIGYRADENWRRKPSPDKRVTRAFPLIDALITKTDIRTFWNRQPFDLLVEDGDGNCDGCFLKSEDQLGKLCAFKRERHLWWEAMESLATSLTRSKGGARFRDEYTRADLRKFIDRHGYQSLTQTGALCQADGGECVI